MPGAMLTALREHVGTVTNRELLKHSQPLPIDPQRAALLSMDSICVKAADMLTQSREHGTQHPAGASPASVSDHFEVPTGLRLAARSELGRETHGEVFSCRVPCSRLCVSMKAP